MSQGLNRVTDMVATSADNDLGQCAYKFGLFGNGRSRAETSRHCTREGLLGAPVTSAYAAWFSRPAVLSDRRAVGSWGSAGWGSCRSRLRPETNRWPTWPKVNIQVASLVN
jgi:hypothetical protein